MGRGGYGEEETNQDEGISRKVIERVCNRLMVENKIPGFKYRILDKIPENMYLDVPADCKAHSIVPDVPAIFVQSLTDPKDFYLVVSGDDKYQATKGNAIERFGKNMNAFYNGITQNMEICPYILFCAGDGFFKDGTYDDFMMSKFRSEFIGRFDGYWRPNSTYSPKKGVWNLVYFKRERFTDEEKGEVLYKTALESVNYIIKLLENKTVTYNNTSV